MLLGPRSIAVSQELTKECVHQRLNLPEIIWLNLADLQSLLDLTPGFSMGVKYNFAEAVALT
jgi:hypothetical protein